MCAVHHLNEMNIRRKFNETLSNDSGDSEQTWKFYGWTDWWTNVWTDGQNESNSIISTPLRYRGLKWLMGQSYNCVALKNGCPFFPSIQVIYLFYLFIQYLKRVAYLATIASLLCGPYKLCKINSAIVLYGSVHQHRILSFIFWHEDTSTDHPSRISMYEITG